MGGVFKSDDSPPSRIDYPCSPEIGVLVASGYGDYETIAGWTFKNFVYTWGAFIVSKGKEEEARQWQAAKNR